MTNNILEIDSVNLSFGDRKILSDIYLKCEKGKITGILGRNGSGKSCLLKIIFGTLKPNYTSIRLNRNVIISELYKLPKTIAYLPQFDFLSSNLKVQQVIHYFTNDDRIFEVSEINKLENKRISQLSGGQRRLLQTYSILYSDVKFILLDEPFTHISPVQCEELSWRIKDISLEKGVILTDHLYENVIELSDDLFLLQEGKSHLIKSREDLIDMHYLFA